MNLNKQVIGGLLLILFMMSNGRTQELTKSNLNDATSEVISVNFQNESVTPPVGWLRDFGEAYSIRAGATQSEGLRYGWVSGTDQITPVSIVGKGRSRNSSISGEEILQATFMHMQHNGSSNIWEIELANGYYDVTVSVGDLSYFDSENTINIEGVPAIQNFIPNSGEKFRSATLRVEVLDGKLTVDAVGGTNTKINSIDIHPAPRLEFAENTLQFITSQTIGTNTEIIKTIVLTTSTGENATTTLTKSSDSDWLLLPANPAFGSLDLRVNASGLDFGTYNATVTASAEGYNDETLEVILRVEEDGLVFTNNTLHFEVQQGSSYQRPSLTQQTVELFAIGEDTPDAIKLTSHQQDNWLIVPDNDALGMLTFDVDAGGLAPGEYTTTVLVSAPGYVPIPLSVHLKVAPLPLNYIWKYKINFQPGSSVTPEGYIADVGKAYGSRGNFEGEDLAFGWLDLSTGNPVSNEANMRERSSSGYGKEYATLGLLEASKPGSAWAMELPNGQYLIEVVAGDTPYLDSEHSLNAEGVNVVSFVPTSQHRFGKGSVELEVKDNKLTLDGVGGNNSKISYVWIGVPNPAQDSVPPLVSIEFDKATLSKTGIYANQVTAGVKVKDPGGSGVVTTVYSFDGGISWTAYVNELLLDEPGKYSLQVRATDANGNVSTTPVYTFEVTSAPVNHTKMVLENKDKFPENDELSFSRIQNSWKGNANHDKVVLRVYNRGTEDLRVEDLRISNENDWIIDHVVYSKKEYQPDALLPVNITPNTFMDIEVHFIAIDPPNLADNGVTVLHETLTIISNDATHPVKEVQLHGLWQRFGESNREPTTNQILEAFGLTTRTGFDTKKNGRDFTPTGDEVVTFFWEKANPREPVYVRQLAAYHTCCRKSVDIKYRDQSGNNDPYTQRKGDDFIEGGHIGLDGQSILPRNNAIPKDGIWGKPAEGTVHPEGLFNVTLGNNDCSNAFLNYPTKNDPNTLGYIGIRVWKMKNSKGEVIPNTYIMSNDYLGGGSNFDYNDNVYIFSNIRPSSGSVHYSELVTGNGVVNDPNEKQSALDFAESTVGIKNEKTLYVRSLGKIYEDGNDPDIVISSVEIVGTHRTEFLVEAPVKPVLRPHNALVEQPDYASVKVYFAPTNPGVKQAVLLIHYENGNKSKRVPLFGIATYDCNLVKLEKKIKMAAPDVNPITINQEAWESDVSYRIQDSNYKLYTLNNSVEIAETDNDELYTSYMSSNTSRKPLEYQIPVPNGKYVVRLHLVEHRLKEENKRVSHILLEGEHKLVALDIYKEAGYRTALVKDLEVEIVDGTVDLALVPLANRPVLAGLELFRVESLVPLELAVQEITGATCEETTGVIEVATTGTDANVVYKLGKYGSYQSSGRFENLTTGTYTIYTKEDIANGCEIAKAYEVPVLQNAIDFVLDLTEVGCENQASASATVSQITGGTAPYEIVWNHNLHTTDFTVNGLLQNRAYTVTVTDFTGCNTTKVFRVSKSSDCETLAIQNKADLTKNEEFVVKKEKSIRFYPTPFGADDILHIQVSENIQNTENATLNVVDTKGNIQWIQTGSVAELESNLNQQIKNWRSGMYILQIYMNNQSHVFKIVKTD